MKQTADKCNVALPCVQAAPQANAERNTESPKTKAIGGAVALLQGAAETTAAEEANGQGGTQLRCLSLLPGYPFWHQPPLLVVCSR